ncbi:MAG: IS701 family transposase, partial [Gammaproteobacteria bacterium]|nr:IS701 family transposase [Gammaproteobacteria bacterium]
MPDGGISHDRFTRFPADGGFTSGDLRKQVGPVVREAESDGGVPIFDGTVEEKPRTDENDPAARHCDRCKGRDIKGINMLNRLCRVGGVSVPAAFESIPGPVRHGDPGTRREKRRSEVAKNEMLRSMFDTRMKNKIKFSWTLFGSRFGSVENTEHVRLEHTGEFIGALKSGRLAALTGEDRKDRRFTRTDQLKRSEREAVAGRLKGLSFPVRPARLIFTDRDGSAGALYPARSRRAADRNTVATVRKKRRNVEVFRMECLKMRTEMNRFALKSELRPNAVRS